MEKCGVEAREKREETMVVEWKEENEARRG